jgi:hypothetical protein
VVASLPSFMYLSISLSMRQIRQINIPGRNLVKELLIVRRGSGPTCGKEILNSIDPEQCGVPRSNLARIQSDGFECCRITLGLNHFDRHCDGTEVQHEGWCNNWPTSLVHDPTSIYLLHISAQAAACWENSPTRTKSPIIIVKTWFTDCRLVQSS